MVPGPMTDKQSGRLFVISGPSGVGKTVLCFRMSKMFGQCLKVAVSATSRSSRPGEIDATDYFFFTRQKMEELIKTGQLAEWAVVHDNFYGTPKAFLEENRRKGIHILLNIDVQGSRKIRQVYPEAITIFIAPPSLQVLEERLRKRKSDSEEVLQKRLQNARMELGFEQDYHHVLVNNELECAVDDLAKLIKKYLPLVP